MIHPGDALHPSTPHQHVLDLIPSVVPRPEARDALLAKELAVQKYPGVPSGCFRLVRCRKVGEGGLIPGNREGVMLEACEGESARFEARGRRQDSPRE
jgi:hypothetical protein